MMMSSSSSSSSRTSNSGCIQTDYDPDENENAAGTRDGS